MQQQQKMLSCSPWRSSHTHKHYTVAAGTAAGHAPLERSRGLLQRGRACKAQRGRRRLRLQHGHRVRAREAVARARRVHNLQMG